MTYKKEFYRLKEIVQADNVKVYAYKKKSHFIGTDSGGYASVFDRTITVACKPSYKFGIMRLLHEYGHILDYDRWYTTRRWLQYYIYLVSNDHFIRKVQQSTKRSILYSEFLADEQAKRILKRYKSSYPVELINEHQFINVHTRNFELTYGKATPPSIVDIFLKNMHQGITKKD